MANMGVNVDEEPRHLKGVHKRWKNQVGKPRLGKWCMKNWHFVKSSNPCKHQNADVEMNRSATGKTNRFSPELAQNAKSR